MHSYEHAFIFCFGDGYEYAWLNDMQGYLSHVYFDLAMPMFLHDLFVVLDVMRQEHARVYDDMML